MISLNSGKAGVCSGNLELSTELVVFYEDILKSRVPDSKGRKL